MIKFNEEDYYTIPEAIGVSQIKRSTFYDQVKNGKIKVIKSTHGNIISKLFLDDFVKRYFHKSDNSNSPINIEDEWYSNAKNMFKFKEWKINKRIKWAEMDLVDYTKFWIYILKPLWIKDNMYLISFESKPFKRPPKLWFIQHGFKGFVTSFERKYLLKYGINTIVNFFDYLTEKKQW